MGWPPRVVGPFYLDKFGGLRQLRELILPE